ncbi:hypothetical protein GCM10027176_47570 [Actinoallomurus bryophytorum]
MRGAEHAGGGRPAQTAQQAASSEPIRHGCRSGAVVDHTEGLAAFRSRVGPGGHPPRPSNIYKLVNMEQAPRVAMPRPVGAARRGLRPFPRRAETPAGPYEARRDRFRGLRL